MSDQLFDSHITLAVIFALLESKELCMYFIIKDSHNRLRFCSVVIGNTFPMDNIYTFAFLLECLYDLQ